VCTSCPKVKLTKNSLSRHLSNQIICFFR